jgi:hypothetical protein
MTHRLTHTLATTLAGAKDVEEYDGVAAAIEALTEDFGDERKADLYALIHESVNRDMSFVELSGAVDAALQKNERRFLGGES